MTSFGIIGQRSGFAISFGPRRWLVAEPAISPPEDNRDTAYVRTGPSDDYWAEVYHRAIGDNEIDIFGYRLGAIVIDYSRYPSGMLTALTPDFPQPLMDAINERVKVSNAFALCLASAIKSEERLDVGYFSIDSESIHHCRAEDSREPSLRMPLPMHYRPGYFRHQVVEKTTLDKATDLLDSLIRSDDNLIEIAALLNRASVLLAQHDTSQANVLGWTVCEALLGIKWREYYGRENLGTRSAVNNARRKRFDTGREFSSSVIMEVLDLADCLDPKLYKPLSEARAARNNWIHNLKRPTWSTVDSALVPPMSYSA